MAEGGRIMVKERARGISQQNIARPVRSDARELQRYGSLLPMPIGLDDRVRSESIALLNYLLADSIILYNLYKKHHWLMRGHTFYQLHLLLDKHASEQLGLIDVLAERVQTLGGIAVADPRHVAELTSIERPPNGAEEVPAMLERLLDAHAIVIEKTHDAIERTEKSKDWGTNDLLMSDILRGNELQAWFVREHLDAAPAVEG
jgi:starvation-inducible DNA-binding protein